MSRVAFGLFAGALLGGAYFGALWLTVRRIPSARRPGILALGSYLARLLLLGAGLFAVVRAGGAAATVSALLGLLAVRQILVARWAPGPAIPPASGWR